MKRTLYRRSEGFTIVELLIATLVFSVVLLTVTIGIIQISRVYYKGLNETDVQNTTRTIMDNITQAIQFSGGKVTTTPTPAVGTMQAFCIGTQQYSYKLGSQLVESSPSANQTTSALRLNTGVAGCNSATPPKTTGQEYLSPRMRVSNLKVEELSAGELYKVTVRIVFGDDDLLNNPTSPNATCRPVSGSQFCTVSELTSTVYKRVGAE